MKKIFTFCFLLSVLLTFHWSSYGANSMSVLVQAIDPNGNLSTVAYPQLMPTTNIAGIKVTITGTMSTSFGVTDSSGAPSLANWGIYFANTASPTTPVVSCSKNSPCDSTTDTVDTTNSSAPTATQVSGSSYSYNAGSITIILTIQGFASNNLPNDLVNLFSNASSASVGFLYNSGTNSVGADYAIWQPDVGLLVNGPTLAGNNTSVVAQDGFFEVTNISPPSDLSAVCPAAAAAPTTCVADGTAAGSGGVLATSSTPKNTVSGYVIGFWKDADCMRGGFTFTPNWMAYAYKPNNPYSANYTCAYQKWLPSYQTGGTSSALGCTALTPPITFFTGAATPNLDTGATPYINISGNPKLDLQTLMSNPGVAYKSQANDSCVSYVYLSSSAGSQQTYTSGLINNGDTYGVVVWALNNASGTPNYSLSHSNIFYTTGVNFIIASTAKSSGLGKSKDCFVVTAASGDTNSPSVFYWRILRDAYLTPLGITQFYYRHAQVWAQWLEEHPRLKPPLNFIFAKSGYAFYRIGQFVERSIQSAKKIVHKFGHSVYSLFESEAKAEESLPSYFLKNQNIAFSTVPSDSKSNFGFDQTNEQQNIDVTADDLSKDQFFSVNKKIQTPPRYEFALTAGLLLPSDDETYYDNYYSSQKSMYGQGDVSILFWWKNIALSLGFRSRYLTNSQNDTVNVLGSTASYSRSFYAISAESLVGLRFRNPDFLYLQPSLFAAGGVTRFREDARANNGSSNTTKGITVYNPIYEGGGNLDMSISQLTGQTSEADMGDILQEALFRISISYNYNPTDALSSTGLFMGAGFVFLLN